MSVFLQMWDTPDFDCMKLRYSSYQLSVISYQLSVISYQLSVLNSSFPLSLH
ncbi:hypothetical protein MICAE_2450032 [Microcystis aeruginosa PCC 9806]|uniref:Uncharacterized protein n=1 Tax=Microcystis aeruginosa PCC 9806 TaxID=1160282 RepID=I4GWW6_MICAE|nr:hypothetical protein MICAE_2450032 [Microcystis aeruginosa PCC 9806]